MCTQAGTQQHLLAQVWLARCAPLEEEVALKIIEMDNMSCGLVSLAACLGTKLQSSIRKTTP